MRLKTGAAACGVALGLTGALAFGAGVAQAAPYTNTPTLTVSDPNPQPGETETVTGTNYVGGEAVTLVGHSIPVTFGTVTASAAGGFTTTIVVPEDWRCSVHTLTGTGASGDAASAGLNVQGCDNGGNPGHGHDHDHFHFHHGFRDHDGDSCDEYGDDSDSYSDSDSDDCFDPGDGPDRPHYSDEDLPSTGAQVLGLGAAGSALIAGGVLLTARRIRRSRSN